MMNNRSGSMSSGGAQNASSWYTVPNDHGEAPDSSFLKAVGGGNEEEMDMGNASYVEDDYDNEPPLLEELGINFELIFLKTQAVVYPNRIVETKVADDADMAGPISFCLILGFLMLMRGQVNFGYIYGFSVTGCVALYSLLDLLHPASASLAPQGQQQMGQQMGMGGQSSTAVSGGGISIWLTCSILGTVPCIPYIP